MRFLFSGFYGYRNIGDDVFCVVADWGAQQFWQSNGNYFIGKNLPQLSHLAHPVYPDRNKFPGHRTCSLVAHAACSDNLVFFGGSTLHSAPARWMKAYSNPITRAVTGKRTSAVGVSIGPFRSVQDEKVVQQFLNQLSFLAVRDLKSYEIAKSMNLGAHVVRAFDVAALYPDAVPLRRAEKVGKSHAPPVIGISACNVERYIGGNLFQESRRINWMTDVLRGLVAQGANLNFFVFNGDEKIGDMPVTRQIIADLGLEGKAPIINYTRNTKEFVSNMLACDAIFGTRLHASILAYAFKVPFLLVEYHRKCSDFLDEVQYEPLRRVGDADASVEETVSNLIALANQSGSIRTKMPLEEARKMALRNFFEAPFGRYLDAAPT